MGKDRWKIDEEGETISIFPSLGKPRANQIRCRPCKTLRMAAEYRDHTLAQTGTRGSYKSYIKLDDRVKIVYNLKYDFTKQLVGGHKLIKTNKVIPYKIGLWNKPKSPEEWPPYVSRISLRRSDSGTFLHLRNIKTIDIIIKNTRK